MMKPIIRPRTDPEETRSRILEVAENFFRSIGYQKTSVADIAAELGMSPANIYRFFPSKGAINECICGRIVEEVAEIAFAIARTKAPASEKLTRLLTAIHQHNKATLIKEKRTHDMVAAAMQENWSIIKAHIERMTTIMEGIIREGVEAGEFDVCTMIYAEYRSAISQIVTPQQLIPFAPPKSDGKQEAESGNGLDGAVYEYEPGEEEILTALLPTNISIQVFKALLENAASEHGARMTAMDNATRNAGEMINNLTLIYNRTRQAAITGELIEIISAKEAM